MIVILLSALFNLHLKSEKKISINKLTKVLSTSEADREGCYDAFTGLADSLVAVPNPTATPNPTPTPTPNPNPDLNPESESETEPEPGQNREQSPKKIFNFLDETTDPLTTFKNQCLATAAKPECSALVSKLTADTASQNDKDTFKTVCKVDEPKGSDAGHHAAKLSHVLLVLSLSIVTLVIN